MELGGLLINGIYHIWKAAGFELSKGKLVVSFWLPAIIFLCGFVISK